MSAQMDQMSDREHVVEATTNPLQGEYKAEYRMVRPEGAIRWVRSRAFYSYCKG